LNQSFLLGAWTPRRIKMTVIEMRETAWACTGLIESE